MPATKIRSDWVSGNLVFKEKVRGNDGQVIFGDTKGGVDVIFYGTTGSIYSMWDESANAWVNKDINLELGDSDLLYFGDLPDVSLCWDATGKLALVPAVTSTFQQGTSTANINTRFVGTLIVGSTGKSLGKDVTFYGTTAVARMLWDADQNTLDFDGAGVHLDDTDKLRMGDSTDASLCWDAAGKIALTAATASTFQLGTSGAKINTRSVGSIIVGSTGKSVGEDVTLYGTTAVARVIWDADLNTLDFDGAGIHLDDTDKLRLGDSTDATLCWDVSKIALVAATTSTFQVGSATAMINTRFVGTLTVGSTGANLGKDVTLYGTSTAARVIWDADLNTLDFDGAGIHLDSADKLRLGDSTNATLCWDTSKVALVASTAASKFQVGDATNNINTRFVGTLTVGTTGTNIGKNVILYGTTTANNVTWTAASDVLVLTNTDIMLKDNDYLKLGSSTDASLCWDSTKIALTAVANGSGLQIGTSTANINTRFVGTVIVGSTASVGKDVTFYGSSAPKSVVFTAASNLLALNSISLKLGNADTVRGTSTAEQTYSLNAWGTATSPVITLKNSTGNAAVKMGFFGKTDGVRIATIAASTTLSTVISGFNTLLAGLKVLGLVST